MYAQNPPTPPNEFTEVDAQAIAIEALQARAASAAKMLNYVAAFSIVNSVLHMINMPFGLAFGLCVTKLIDAISGYTIFGLLFDLIPVGVYFLIAYMMKKHYGWFILGMVLYLIDGFLALALIRLHLSNTLNLIISTAVHGYVLYLLWQGYSASRAAHNLQTMPSGSYR